MADCIASLGCDRFEMDAWGADVMVAASQKGLMVPPGMCFVFFNDRADRARERRIASRGIGIGGRGRTRRNTGSISTGPRRRIICTGFGWRWT